MQLLIEDFVTMSFDERITIIYLDQMFPSGLTGQHSRAWAVGASASPRWPSRSSDPCWPAGHWVTSSQEAGPKCPVRHTNRTMYFVSLYILCHFITCTKKSGKISRTHFPFSPLTILNANNEHFIGEGSVTWAFPTNRQFPMFILSTKKNLNRGSNPYITDISLMESTFDRGWFE